jgi:hypothetical protein
MLCLFSHEPAATKALAMVLLKEKTALNLAFVATIHFLITDHLPMTLKVEGLTGLRLIPALCS